MAVTQAWRATGRDNGGGGGEGVILAIDFTTTGRPEAGFGTLMELAGTRHALWESIAPAPGDEAGMTGPDYLDRWTQELRATEVDVRAVFGYCASSVFALAVAERIGAWQAKPRVVLFDPTAITGSTVLRDDFYRVIDALAAVLSPEEVEQIRSAGRAAQAEHPDLAELTGEFVRIYRDAGSAAFARIGLQPDRVDELVAWFRSYLHYLVAASKIIITPDLDAVTVIRSSDLPASLVQATHELRFDIEHTALLGHAEVAHAVAELLT